jgi:hypothetical protein
MNEIIVNSLKDLKPYLNGDIYSIPPCELKFKSSVSFSFQNKRHKKNRQSKKYLKKFGMTHRYINLLGGEYVFRSDTQSSLSYSGNNPLINGTLLDTISIIGDKS